MSNATHGTGYGMYWIVWVLLLVLTLIMLGMEFVTLPQWMLLAVLLVAMMVKASVISGYFMHLRYEKKGLIWLVGASIILAGLVMFTIMAVDAVHVFQSSAE